MAKGYKKEYIEKVKNKFNDLQSGGRGNQNNIGKSSNDSRSVVCQSTTMVKSKPCP